MQAPLQLPDKAHGAAHAAEGTKSAGLPPAGGALKPNPAAALRLEMRRVHGWDDAQGRAHFQLELRLANDTGATLPEVAIACPACEVQTLWNVRLHAAGGDRHTHGAVLPAGGDVGRPEAGHPPSLGPQGEPGFSWKQLWGRGPQRDTAGLQASAGCQQEAAARGACRDSGMQAAGLPAWMLEQGGLPCGGQLVFGGIFLTDAPSISVAAVYVWE